MNTTMKPYLLPAALIMLMLVFLLTPTNATAAQDIEMSMREPIVGSVVHFKAVGFKVKEFKWDFGDGTSKRGNGEISHTYKRSGLFKVNIFEAGDLAKELMVKRVRVRRDNRIIKLPKGDTVVAGTEVTIEAHHFLDNGIKWNTGDGSPVRNMGTTINHRFTRSGTFHITAVDLNGKDSKKIKKKIRVLTDNRSIITPKQIIPGEPADLDLRVIGAKGYNTTWQWRFSDGSTGQGNSIGNKIFKKPGQITVTIQDPKGVFPELRRQITVAPDKRQLKSDLRFALPNEDVGFTALHFMGKTIKWNFDDGTTETAPNRRGKRIHAFKKTGTYTVRAVDHGGKSTRTFQLQIRVAEHSSNFSIAMLELAFANGKYYHVAKRNQATPDFSLSFKTNGRGIIKGKWLLDDMVIGLFQVVTSPGQIARVERDQRVELPVQRNGPHTFTFQLTNHKTHSRVPILRYFVTDTGEILPIHPEPGKKIAAQQALRLQWTFKHWDAKTETPMAEEGSRFYEIAVSEIPFQFLREDQLKWRKVGKQKEFQLDTSKFNSWVYWQVRQKDNAGNIRNISQVASFKVTAAK